MKAAAVGLKGQPAHPNPLLCPLPPAHKGPARCPACGPCPLGFQTMANWPGAGRGGAPEAGVRQPTQYWNVVNNQPGRTFQKLVENPTLSRILCQQKLRSGTTKPQRWPLQQPFVVNYVFPCVCF